MSKEISFGLWGASFIAFVDYSPGRPARTSGPPDNWEPEEPEEIVIKDLRVRITPQPGCFFSVPAQWVMESDLAEQVEDAVMAVIGSEIERQNAEQAEAEYKAHVETIEMFHEMGM